MSFPERPLPVLFSSVSASIEDATTGSSNLNPQKGYSIGAA
jgi:hypothetical protein